MTTDAVVGRRAIFLGALLLFLCGCATTQRLADEDRRKISAVRINSTVQKSPEMFYLGPGTSVFFAFGALGGAAAYASSVAPAMALQDFAEKNGIFIDKIAFQEVDAAFRQSGKVKVSNPEEPTDAVVNVIVYTYGFGVTHGFSSRLVPVVGIRCELADAAGKVLGSAYDYVHAIGNPAASMTLEEMRDDPKRIENAWRIAAKRIAGNIAKELGYDGGLSLTAAATTAPPTASAAALAAAAAPAAAALATPVMASVRTYAPRAGIPSAGSQWVYGIIDRQYGRRPIDMTVVVTRADGSSIEESLTSSGSSKGETQRTVSADESRFLLHGLAGGAELTEFAPYFLAANGEKASSVSITAAGYPVGAGFPEWVARTKPQIWEQVTVPAGTFKALRLEISGQRVRAPSDPNATREFLIRVWYAPEVQRYVRLEHKEWMHSSRQISHVVVELTKFSPPT